MKESSRTPTVFILRHMPQEGAGTIEAALTRAGVEFRYFDLFRKVPSHLPLDEASGLVVLGGAMNVDEVEKYPFLAMDVRWVEQALSRELPLLGVCLGSQLLAKTLGARVYPNRVKEIGWYTIDFLPAADSDPVFAQRGARTVFQWHGDTFDLPSGATHLARAAQCENQAFRYGKNAYGLQFHIEMTAAMIEDWLCEQGNCRELSGLDYIDPQTIRRETPQELPGLQNLAADVLGRFAKMCYHPFAVW